MVDKLDLQILDIIWNAASIVRSVTEKEIRSGVLSPSVTAMDIKRNLRLDIDLSVIEGRLRALESDGHIYYELDRWWLTSKGRETLGKPSTDITASTSYSKPMREILEETFAKFEADMQTPPHTVTSLEKIEYFKKRKTQAEALSSELKRSYELGLISEVEYKRMVENINRRLRELDSRIKLSILSRRNELLIEIEILEKELHEKVE
ncbi:MAG: hypothetical protein QG670_19 [Thermoproteota archaeon]|nr:hypothetical protein [Thermoproteota archaeon]